MKRPYYIIFAGFLVAANTGLVSCSDEEDTTPSAAEQNLFAPSSDDTSEEAAIRNSFYNETTSFLLFNDTLKKVQTGTDAYGAPVYEIETVDVGYSMFQSGKGSEYTYEYIETIEEKKEVTELVKEKIAKRLGKKCAPYSFLIVNNCTKLANYNGQKYPDPRDPYPMYVLGSRCYVISLYQGSYKYDPNYFDNIFMEMLVGRLDDLGENALADFRAPISDYFYNSYGYLYPRYKSSMGYPQKKNDDLARSLGFLKDHSRYYFCYSWADDMNDYLEAVLQYSEAEFEAEYAQYPIVIQRFKELRSVISELGIEL